MFAFGAAYGSASASLEEFAVRFMTVEGHRDKVTSHSISQLHVIVLYTPSSTTTLASVHEPMED